MARTTRSYIIFGILLVLTVISLHTTYRLSSQSFDSDFGRLDQNSVTSIKSTTNSRPPLTTELMMADDMLGSYQAIEEEKAEKEKAEKENAEKEKPKQEKIEKEKAGNEGEKKKTGNEKTEKEKAEKEKAEKEKAEKEKADKEKAEKEKAEKEKADKEKEKAEKEMIEKEKSEKEKAEKEKAEKEKAEKEKIEKEKAEKEKAEKEKAEKEKAEKEKTRNGETENKKTENEKTENEKTDNKSVENQNNGNQNSQNQTNGNQPAENKKVDTENSDANGNSSSQNSLPQDSVDQNKPEVIGDPEETLESTLQPQNDPWETSVEKEVHRLEDVLANQREKAKIDQENDRKTDIYLKPIEFTEEDKENGALHPTGPDIVLISASDNNGNRTKLSMAMQNRNEYAKKWGYRSYFVDLEKFKGGDTDAGQWLKVAAIKEVYKNVPDAKWYFWLDSDIIIMNPSIDMASHCLHPKALAQRIMYGTSIQGLHREPLITYPDKEIIDLDDIDIILSKDKLSIQTGALFFRRSEFMTFFLEIWDDSAFINMGFEENEQDAMLYLALHHPSLIKHMGLIQQRLLNPYPHYHRSDTGNWQESDFMIHFPGTEKHNDDEYTAIWTKYWDMRNRVEEQFQLPFKMY